MVQGFIKGRAPGELTSSEDGFAQLLLASLQLYIFNIFKALHKLYSGAKSKCPPALNLNETPLDGDISFSFLFAFTEEDTSNLMPDATLSILWRGYYR